MAERGGTALARALEASLSERASTAMDADRALLDALTDAHASAARAIQRLDDVQIELDNVAAGLADPALDTPTGTRELQQFLLAKQREIVAIVAQAVADNETGLALVESLTDQYSVTRPDSS